MSGALQHFFRIVRPLFQLSRVYPLCTESCGQTRRPSTARQAATPRGMSRRERAADLASDGSHRMNVKGWCGNAGVLVVGKHRCLLKRGQMTLPMAPSPKGPCVLRTQNFSATGNPPIIMAATLLSSKKAFGASINQCFPSHPLLVSLVLLFPLLQPNILRDTSTWSRLRNEAIHGDSSLHGC